MKALRHTRIAAAACTALVALLGTCALASPVEHAVDVTNAADFVRLRYGDHTVNAGLATPLEADRYTFVAGAGDRVQIALHTLTAGLDPSLVLRGPTGTILKSVACAGQSFGTPVLCSTALDQSLTAAGVYTLNVSDVGADDTGSYQFHIDGHPPIDNWVGLAYGAVNEVSSSIGHTTDSDYFAFNGVAGTVVRLTVRTTTAGAGLDPYLEVWNPAGARISNTVCNGNSFGTPVLCSNLADVALEASGVYKIGIYDASWDETGGYKLSVGCQFGNCPSVSSPPPMPVPEPDSIALLIGGLGWLGFATRRRIPPVRASQC